MPRFSIRASGMTRPAIVYLVSCSKTKARHRTKAELLYISARFRYSRLVAIKSQSPWYILSAKFGLLQPTTTVAPYDLSLSNFSVQRRKDWARQVFASLRANSPRAKKIVFLCGKLYSSHLELLARSAGIEVSVPLRGLAMGKQLAWLKHYASQN
jgi:hypothetical protein